MSMYEPYKDQIIRLVEKGLNLKEVHEELKDFGVYGTYEGLHWYCKHQNIKAIKSCGNCQHMIEFTGKQTGNKNKFCTKYDEVVKCEIVPRWCDGGFEKV